MNSSLRGFYRFCSQKKKYPRMSQPMEDQPKMSENKKNGIMFNFILSIGMFLGTGYFAGLKYKE